MADPAPPIDESAAPVNPEPPAAEPERFLIDSPAALRAIAHPLRQQILFELAVRESARAVDLAQTLGQPANSISFHLRALAKAGMIVEAPELAHDRRDRVWRRAADAFEIDRKLPGSSAAVAPILDWLRASIESEPDEHAHGEFTARPILLSKAEAKQLGAELTAVIERWHDQAQEGESRQDGADRIHHQVLFAVGRRRLGGSHPLADQLP